MALLEVINVKKWYEKKNMDRVVVLNEINTTVYKGELLSILGKSGSGKSTLMYVMSGLLAPSEGTVLFNGENITAYDDRKISYFRNSEVGFIHQNFFLEPTYSALENVALPLIVKRVNRKLREKVAYEMLKKVGLEGREKHKPSELSGGEMQRVCIARAIISRPKIVFADEPTGNLDIENSGKIMHLLCGLAKEDMAIILATHDEQAARMSSRIIHISDGKLYEE